MHPLSSGDQRLSKALGELADNAVQISTAVNSVSHAGHVNLDLCGGETVDCIPFCDVPQVFKLFLCHGQSISGLAGIVGGFSRIGGDVTKVKTTAVTQTARVEHSTNFGINALAKIVTRRPCVPVFKR